MSLLKIILFLSILCVFCTNCEANIDQIVISTTSGRIKGQQLDFDGHQVLSFSGIRYAKPPVGELRFAKPHPVDPWNHIYDATSQGNSCWQTKGMNSLESFGLKEDEDCLFLNVWTPRVDGKLPIMFFIHGGGLVIGSSYEKTYDGIVLSALENVIVATINYRLNFLGFLYADHEQIPGNVSKNSNL
jgi:carboxylesterase type B